MGIAYYRLFDQLNRKGLKKTDLREVLSSRTIAKLSKGEHISTATIETLCKFLDCQPENIMEYIPDEENIK